MFVKALSNEINKLKVRYQSDHKKPDVHALMEAMMRGGWTELIKAHGGETLSFAIRTPQGNLEVFREFYIPEISAQNNVLGFLLSKDDVPDTKEVSLQQVA